MGVEIHLADVVSLPVLLTLLAGTVIGLIVGALPGVGPVTAMAVLLPFTFKMQAMESIAFMTAIWASGIYAGSWTAILINVPGTSMSVATTLDGYPMAQQGRALEALGAATFASFLSGVTGVLILFVGAPFLATYMVMVGPPEFVWIYVLALVVMSVSFEGLRGFTGCLLGLSLALVGIDVVVGVPRYTFGTLYLQDGIGLIPALVGLFGFTEAIALLQSASEKRDGPERIRSLHGSLWSGFAAVIRHWRTLFVSMFLGGTIGVIPGMGASAANLLAWGEAKKRSRIPETFGQGNVEGVVASEASNNVVEGASLIPTLALGIPGSASAAIMLTALTLQGFQPGRTLIQEGNFMTALLAVLIIAQVMMLLVGIVLMPGAAFISLVPREMLTVTIMAFCFIGVYSVRNSLADVVVAAVLGAVGYILRRHNYAVIGVVVGLILGGMMERAVSQSLAMSGGSVAIFFTRPISLGLVALIILFTGRRLAEVWRSARA